MRSSTKTKTRYVKTSLGGKDTLSILEEFVPTQNKMVKGLRSRVKTVVSCNQERKEDLSEKCR